MIKKYLIRSLFCLITLVSLFLIVDFFCPLNMAKLKQQSTVFLSDRGEAIHVTMASDDIYRLPVEIADISPLYLKLLMDREDRSFYHHWGIDISAVIRAAGQYMRYGRVISGASTLTMQTARLLEPRPRNVKSKFIDMFRALQLEWHYSKDDILKMYLNLIPCGGNVEGIYAASHVYFEKKPTSLTLAEAALLVMLPQSPTLFRPDVHQARAQVKRDKILRSFKARDIISEDEFLQALQEPVLAKRAPFPREIPHLARLLMRTGKQQTYNTFIDAGLQAFLADLLFAGKERLPFGANAAILVHDHVENKVVGYAGSRDFFEEACGGQVDYIQAIRSPGSTLKPLIFGLAFDGGYITPETYFWDERKHFGAYAPHNFDHQHYGMVRGSESLQMSLNVPAVELLKMIGPVHFYGAMKSIDLNPQFERQDVMPNLSMALGGMGMSLVDLVMLYSAFGEEGKATPLRFLNTHDKGQPRYLMYPTSATQLTEILKVNPLNRRGHLDQRPVALKTGTSYGYRDALAIAYDQRFTVGVWVGMPKGGTLGMYTGLDLAVPFVERVFQKLPVKNMVGPGDNFAPLPAAFKVKAQTKENVLVSASHTTQLPLKLQYPLPGSQLLRQDQKPVQVKASGGKKPYNWFVNGKILQEDVQIETVDWQPDSNGFYRLTVQDAEGHIAWADVELSGLK